MKKRVRFDECTEFNERGNWSYFSEKKTSWKAIRKLFNKLPLDSFISNVAGSYSESRLIEILSSDDYDVFTCASINAKTKALKYLLEIGAAPIAAENLETLKLSLEYFLESLDMFERLGKATDERYQGIWTFLKINKVLVAEVIAGMNFLQKAWERLNNALQEANEENPDASVIDIHCKSIYIQEKTFDPNKQMLIINKEGNSITFPWWFTQVYSVNNNIDLVSIKSGHLKPWCFHEKH